MTTAEMTPEQQRGFDEWMAKSHSIPQPQAAPDEGAVIKSRMIPGGSFILDAPDHVPALWGAGDQVLWAEGESLVLAGGNGVGKTTVAGQLVRGRILREDFLGFPVAKGERVLYLAMDRPRQIARALRRTLCDIPREILDERLVFWPGPPVADIAKHPETLKGYADLAEADTIVVDSLKDAAIGLTDDEVGAGYNRARQIAIAAGIEVLELHHLVKRGVNGARPTALADLYGSVWLTAGAGSVVLLSGDPGDPIVDFIHLKTPAAEVGPWKLIHDHDTGRSQVWHSTDLVMMAKVNGDDGITAKDAARALFSVDHPKAAEVEKARRRLDALVKAGSLTFTEGARETSTPSVWTFTDTFTALIGSETHHAVSEPSRSTESEHEPTFTDTFTPFTRPDLHVRPPSYKEGASESALTTTTITDDVAALGGVCSTCGRFICECETGS
jgi:hypothetical protein